MKTYSIEFSHTGQKNAVRFILFTRSAGLVAVIRLVCFVFRIPAMIATAAPCE